MVDQKIITLGPKGTMSYSAASQVAEERSMEIVYTQTIPQITKSVVTQDTYGVIPIENSVSGTVGQAQDSLISSDIIITNELSIHVRFSLITNTPLNEIKRFYAHPQAFNQTMQFTSDNFPQAEVLFADSNVHSGDLFLKHEGEPIAAIIPASLAKSEERFKTKLLIEDIQDYEDNTTRFFVIQKRPENYSPDFSKEKTSLFINFHEDRHSLLFELLREFHVFGINLSRLESRPSKSSAWKYSFFIDFLNNHRTEACLDELGRNQINYKVLGSYNFLKKK
ncbi:MAG: prephenate dehydratase [bacterium]|jgi:prephenate dehydratase